MAELTIDPDVVQKAVASAIVTMLGDDAPKLIEGLVANVMKTKPSYGQHKDLFAEALTSVVASHVRSVIEQWIKDNAERVNAAIVERIEAEGVPVMQTQCRRCGLVFMTAFRDKRSAENYLWSRRLNHDCQPSWWWKLKGWLRGQEQIGGKSDDEP